MKVAQIRSEVYYEKIFTNFTKDLLYPEIIWEILEKMPQLIASDNMLVLIQHLSKNMFIIWDAKNRS